MRMRSRPRRIPSSRLWWQRKLVRDRELERLEGELNPTGKLYTQARRPLAHCVRRARAGSSVVIEFDELVADGAGCEDADVGEQQREKLRRRVVAAGVEQRQLVRPGVRL